MNLLETVEAQLARFYADTDVNPVYKTPEAKQFVKVQIRSATMTLLHIAKTIRENVHLRKFEHGRPVGNLLNEMLVWGQPIASTLWLAGLREKVTDLIEHYYGVSFSSLAIHVKVIDKTDGQIVFILFNPSKLRPGGKYTLSKDGNLFFVDAEEFAERFTIVKSKA